jgi:hypothetical protein
MHQEAPRSLASHPSVTRALADNKPCAISVEAMA